MRVETISDIFAYGHHIYFDDVSGVDKKEHNTIEILKFTGSNIQSKLTYTEKYFHNQGRDIVLGSNEAFSRTSQGRLWSYEVIDVVYFFWHSGTKRIYYIPQKLFTPYLLRYWTLHIVLPLFLSIEEIFVFLHTGAVEVAETPVLFVAESFGGKSTLTDFFIKKGHAMLTDDKLACYKNNNTFVAVPSYSYHRPYRDLEDLGCFVENFSTISKPVKMLYQLEKATTDSHIDIVELHGVEKFKALRYSLEFNLSFLKRKQFGFLIAIAKKVSVYKILVPWDLDRLDEVYMAIVVHCESV